MATAKFNGRSVSNPIMKAAILGFIALMFTVLAPFHLVLWLAGRRGFFYMEDDAATAEIKGALTKRRRP